MRTLKQPADFIGNYGQDWTRGVIVDHVGLLLEAAVVVTSTTVTIDGEVLPILCGELVWIDTEDGGMDGRCGQPVLPGDAFCEGHAFHGEA